MKSGIEQLIGRVLQGDRDSFCELVMKYQHAVYGLAFHYLKNFADAEDVTQEVFLEAYQHLGTLKHPERFGSWLNGIATNLCKMWLRRQRQTLSIDELGQQEEQAASPMEVYEQHDLHERVMSAISQLPEPNRIVLTLYSMDGLSYEEIGAFLDVPIGTVRSRIHRARQTLKKELAYMVTQDLGKHEIDPELARRVANFLKERQDHIIALWSDDMSVIDGRASKAVHRDAISSFLSLMIDQFEHTDAAKSPDELTRALTRRYNGLTADEFAGMMFLLQGIIVLDFFGHAHMDLHEAVHHQTVSAMAGLPGSGDIKWGFGVGSMDIKETASAIQTGSSGTYGRRYVNENQVKKNLFPGYTVKYYAGNPSELLQIPVSIGKSWMKQDSGYTFRSIIASISETIGTPAGEFTNCVKVKTLITGKRINSDGEENPEIDVFVRGTRFMWFAPGVGLVKVKYNHEEGSATEISLIDYSIEEAGKGYFPLALGNIWRYEWADTYSDYMNHEVWRVAEKRKDSYNIRCFNRVSHLKRIAPIEQEAPEKKRILLVSDKEAELESLKEMLLEEDHDVTTATSGSEALSTMRNSLFDVVAIDDFVTTREKTPEMSGMELLQKIKQLSPYPQVIVMIVFTTVDKIVKMMRLGAYDVIERPFSPGKFMASIRQAIEKAKIT